MENQAPSCVKVDMHWHFYGRCGVSISSIRYRKNPDLETMHYHDFYELVIVREGTARHLYPGGSSPLGKGNFFVIRPGRPHSYADCRNFELANVLFFPELLLFPWEKVEAEPGIRLLLDSVSSRDGCPAPEPPPCLNAGTFDAIEPFLQALTRERREKKPDYELAMNANFLYLLLNLSRSILGSESAPANMEPRLQQVIAFLKTGYSSPQLAISEIARKNSMTIKTMERLFRKYTGISPAAYLAGLRLEHAAELLRSPACSITDAAFRCGFSNLAYFSRVFHRRYGISPREYRQRACAHLVSPQGASGNERNV